MYPLEVAQKIEEALREYNRVLEDYQKYLSELAKKETELEYKKCITYIQIKEKAEDKSQKLTEGYINALITHKLHKEIEEHMFLDTVVKVLKEKMKYLLTEITAMQTILNYMREEYRKEEDFEKL